ncbi:GNAT family N-acetyltransferase [Methylobacterium sp. WL8]|uniref:GNAT family N-acetyltransferase n=1 Tax=Methylobacterium sp. WL8 TaxID=2603899 RepID=UPI0011C8ED3A|nr:GNAT family N-acetyltransferase [Methylobacterium sp. WL8]TXN84294.1 N-acetyltransferase [Methylobacterium sp. WL8]
MTPNLRPAVEADIPAITRIYADAVLNGTASFEVEPPTEAEMARRRSALVADGFPYLAAEQDGVVRGYAYAGPYRARAAYRSTVEDSVYVAEAARGLGIGRALLTALIAACEAIDARAMVAVITDPGSETSAALHVALGFAHVGVLDNVGHKHGRWLGTVLMQRRLGPGPDTAPTRA